MFIKSSANLRNEYGTISSLAKESGEPIYITVNGQGDGVYMSLDAYERMEQSLLLRARVLAAEEDRLNGAETYSPDYVRQIIANKCIKEKDTMGAAHEL